ncbi:hypothetical protein ABZY33_29020, partial [Streptomyces sp. NPDC006552]
FLSAPPPLFPYLRFLLPAAPAAALASFPVALQRWSTSDAARDPVTLLDDAFAVIAGSLDGRSEASA